MNMTEDRLDEEAAPLSPPRPHRHLHGRRRGRKLRKRQQELLGATLPEISATPGDMASLGPRGIFEHMPEKIWLEIGFGGGEHLAYQAAAHPEIGIIGCEVFQNGIVSLLNHVQDRQLRNIRVVRDDARLVLEALPEASIDRAFVLFPDPWPKLRHHKRRLISPATMAALARVLGDGAELRLATDDLAYLRVMLAVACGHPSFEWLARRPADWQERTQDWPQTRYEAKALDAGRRPAFLRLMRRKRD